MRLSAAIAAALLPFNGGQLAHDQLAGFQFLASATLRIRLNFTFLATTAPIQRLIGKQRHASTATTSSMVTRNTSSILVTPAAT